MDWKIQGDLSYKVAGSSIQKWLGTSFSFHREMGVPHKYYPIHLKIFRTFEAFFSTKSTKVCGGDMHYCFCLDFLCDANAKKIMFPYCLNAR